LTCDGSGDSGGGKFGGKAGGKAGGKGSGKGFGKGGTAIDKGETTEVVSFNEDIRAIEQQGSCGEEETGHRAAKGGGAHLAYNANGCYVKAAACYIEKKFKEAGGGNAVAV
jgi:hypothetical protein